MVQRDDAIHVDGDMFLDVGDLGVLNEGVLAEYPGVGDDDIEVGDPLLSQLGGETKSVPLNRGLVFDDSQSGSFPLGQLSK